MTSSADVILDPSITLPDGRPTDGRFVSWGFGEFIYRYRIDGAGHLLQRRSA